MKNIILLVITIAILSALAEQFLPWWSMAIVACVVGYFMKQSSFASFMAGFLAIFILWTVYAYVLSHANQHILSGKVAQLLPLQGHVKLLLLATGVIGGLVGGLGALTGNLAKSAQAK